MPSLFRRSNGVYYVAFFDSTRTPPRKTVSTGETHRRAAERRARHIEDDVRDGRILLWDPKRIEDGPAPPPTVEAAVGAFLASRSNLASESQKDYRRLIGRFARTLPAEFSPGAVTSAHVADFIGAASAGAVTQHTYRRHLRVFFRWLIKQRAITHDPTAEVRLEKAPSKHPRFLTPADVESIIRVVNGDPRYTAWGRGLWLLPIVRANVYLGLRAGELVNLRWDAVDLSEGTVAVRCTDDFTTKAARERTLPVADAPLAVLSGMERRGPYVFAGHGGQQIGRVHLSHSFKRLVRAAGLSEDIDFHSTRHTAASWLAQRGASIEAIRVYMGHSSVMVTQRYMHLAP